MASYNPAFDTVETREAAWFTTDPCPGFPAALPLLASNGGPFEVVQAFWQAVDQREHELYIVMNESIETRDQQTLGAMGGMKGWRHSLTLYLYWPVEDPQGSLENEQQAFRTAVASVITRIRGPQYDKTHGQAFAAIGGEAPGDRVQTRFGDVPTLMAQGQPLTAQILYSAYDVFIA
jgi:hypothetical protein